MTSTWPVALLAAFLACAVPMLLQRLRAKRGPGLRAKLETLLHGLILVELGCLPLLVMTYFGEEFLDLKETSAAVWIAVPAYVAFTLLTIVRLFPWQEVEALAVKPDAKLSDLLAALRRGDDEAK